MIPSRTQIDLLWRVPAGYHLHLRVHYLWTHCTGFHCKPFLKRTNCFGNVEYCSGTVKTEKLQNWTALVSCNEKLINRTGPIISKVPDRLVLECFRRILVSSKPVQLQWWYPTSKKQVKSLRFINKRKSFLWIWHSERRYYYNRGRN